MRPPAFNADHEAEHAPVERQVERRGRAPCCDPRDDDAVGPAREERAECRADEREQDAFGEQLAHDARAARAERHADRDLALARGAARDQQIGDVRARNEEDQGDGRHEQPQRMRVRVAQLRESIRSGPHAERPGQVVRLVCVRPVGRQRGFHDAWRRRRKLGADGLDR